MDCWQCERESKGICRFCGRAVCLDHGQTKPFILTVFKNQQEQNVAIVVEDALYCGICKPRGVPTVLKGLE